MKLRLSALACLGILACGSDSETPRDDEKPPGAPLVCEPGSGVVGDACAAAGFAQCPDGKSADGNTCGIHECPAGSFAPFGANECAPIGPASCPTGFEREASGLGCKPILAAACTGATMPGLGASACVDVGDCDAAFPPPAATLFVDGSFTPDATHFKTIQAAVTAAPAGATIAIAAGTYAGSVALTKSVTLVGRCAAQVILDGGQATTPGISASSVGRFAVRGMTVKGFEVGLSSESAAKVEIDDAIVVANKRIGILAADAGTQVTVRKSLVRGTLADASGRFGHGVASGFDAEISVEDSAILDSNEMGASAQRSGTLHVARSIVQGVRQRPGNRAYGWGIGAQSGGKIDVKDSAVLDTFAGAVVAVEAASSVQVSGSYIRGVQEGPSEGGAVAAGAIAQLGGAMKIEGTTIAGSDLYGAFVNTKGKLTMISSVVRDLPEAAVGGAITVGLEGNATLKDIAIVDCKRAGIVVGPSSKVDVDGLYEKNVTATAVAVEKAVVTMKRVVTDEIVPGTGTDGGFGASFFVQNGGSLTLEDAIVRRGAGIALYATRPGSKITFTRGVIADTIADGDAPGFGAVAVNGGELAIEDAAIVSNTLTAIHVADPGSVATLRGVVVADTHPSEDGRARIVNAQGGGSVTLSRSLVIGGEEIGLVVLDADTRAIVEDSIIGDVRASAKDGFGHGVTVAGGGSLTMSRSIVRNNVGVGLVFASASASIASSIVRGNAIGVHVQDGVTLLEAAAAPAELTPDQVIFTSDTRFEGNATRLGSGALPVPAVVTNVGRK